jgi:hypothetical protein
MPGITAVSLVSLHELIHGFPLCLFSLFAVDNNQIAGTLYIWRLPTYPVLET